jgi:hypothetical protein
MSTGRANKLTGQIAEHLVCAELGKRELIATPFAGNVPAFDIIVADCECRTIPIQVKATRSDSWPNQATDWMDIKFDEASNRQILIGPRQISNRNLIYVLVSLGGIDPPSKDRFFILTKADLQAVCIKSYSVWMDTKNWIRPRNAKSYDLRYKISDIEAFEGRWDIIHDRLSNLVARITT